MSSIITQAAQFSFRIVGQFRRCPDLEPSHLYQCYCDDASNRYILRRGILTIVTADGDATKSISRFARNTVTLLATVRELKALGVDVFFEEQHIHTLSADGELMITILASYAQEESFSASENQKWRIRKNFQEGKPWDATILGYRYKNGRYEIEPGEAAIVCRIYDMYLAGRGLQTITNILNEEGAATRFGKAWHISSVRHMVSIRW